MKHYHITDIQNNPNHTILTVEADSFVDEMFFTPGQYATISYKSNTGWSPVRCFSMTNAPGTSLLQFAFRREGPFTSSASQLTVGTAVRVQGAFGEFTLQDPTKDTVLIAGGIGVTPFMSMLRATAAQPTGGKVILLSAHRTLQDIPFYDELLNLRRTNPHVRAYFFITEPLPSGIADHFIQGPINKAHIKELIAKPRHYYICGPDGMMRSIADMLEDQGVPLDSITTESFASTQPKEGQAVSMPRLTYAMAAIALIVLTGWVMFTDVRKYAGGDSISAQTTQASDNTDTSATPTTESIGSENPTTDTTIGGSNNPATDTETLPTIQSDTTQSATYASPRSTVS